MTSIKTLQNVWSYFFVEAANPLGSRGEGSFYFVFLNSLYVNLTKKFFYYEKKHCCRKLENEP